MSNTSGSNTDFIFDFGASETPVASLNTKYATVAQYIADMQDIETNNVPAATATNTQEMITKFRKIYYNSTGWNKILIPDTESVAVLPVSTAEKAMVKSHEIALLDGKSNDNQTLYLEYDVAHIFAVLDASNHNGTLSPLSLLGADLLAKLPSALKDIVPEVHDRMAACGWLGDLSEIIGEFYLQKATTTAAKQKIINQFGAYYKNLANVDSMVMVDRYKDDLTSEDGEKLSALFVKYFGISGTGGDRETLKSTRYKTFAGKIGLTWSGTEFEKAATWVETQKVNLRTCAAFYLANKCLHESTSAQEELKSILKADIEAASQNALFSKKEKEFAQFLKTEVNTSDGALEKDVLTLIICFLMWKGSLDQELSVHDVLSAFVAGLSKAIETTAAAS